MEKVEICPNCGHVFVILESHMAKAGAARCPVCGRGGAPVSVGAEEYKKMKFENKPLESGGLDSKAWLVLGLIFIVGIFVFLMESWPDRICGIAFMGALAAFYIMERMRLQKKRKDD